MVFFLVKSYFLVVQLVAPDDMADASLTSSTSKSSRFVAFLKKTCGVGGALVGAYLGEDDAGQKLSAAVGEASSMVRDAAKDKLVGHIAGKAGAMVSDWSSCVVVANV